jgi:hypothetical protein
MAGALAVEHIADVLVTDPEACGSGAVCPASGAEMRLGGGCSGYY